MNLIFVILVICLIIILHELGHFVAAKLSGVKVEQFTIGFGPAIFKKQVGETLYAIRMLPVGGAVMMKD
jgi:regulator of sigma E protease